MWKKQKDLHVLHSRKGAMHMSASTKLCQLESKLSGLQNQHQFLLIERQQEIAIIISAIDLAHLDDKTLMGGLLFLKEKIIAKGFFKWHTSQ